MPGFGRRIDGPGGRRRSVRENVVLAGSAFAIGSSQSVMIEDVGRAGAKLRAQRVEPVGRQLLVRIGTVEMLASVIWSRPEQCGIRFDEPLDDQTLQAVKKEGCWATVTGSA
ncbi:MAG: PilZ domain-containing protein [Bacillota bacterium]